MSMPSWAKKSSTVMSTPSAAIMSSMYLVMPPLKESTMVSSCWLMAASSADRE